MINTVIIDKPIADVYSIVQSKDYLKYIFDDPIIKTNESDLKLLVTYNKDKTLSKYGNDDFIKFVKTLFTIDDIILSIEQKIVSNDKQFTIRQVLSVEFQHNDIFFATMLSNFKILIEIDVSEYNGMTNMSFKTVEIIENNNFDTNNKKDYEVPVQDIDKHKLHKISIKKYLNNYDKRKDNFFHSDIQYSDNIIINILNIVVNNAVTSEYMRNICEYFAWKNIDIYSIS
jgi:hypothetical protein